MHDIFPNVHSFSATNLKYMKYYYELFSDLDIRPQVGDDSYGKIGSSENRPQLTRDPYNFDFLTIRQEYDEKELKDALMDNLQKFLLELGTGFAFVGREYRLEVGHTEQFLDMLFL